MTGHTSASGHLKAADRAGCTPRAAVRSSKQKDRDAQSQRRPAFGRRSRCLTALPPPVTRKTRMVYDIAIRSRGGAESPLSDIMVVLTAPSCEEIAEHWGP